VAARFVTPARSFRLAARVVMSAGATLLAALLLGPARAESAGEPVLTNDDLCGTSLLGDEGSRGRADEDWNRRLEAYFREGGGLSLRHGSIDHDGPPAGVAVGWFGSRNGARDDEGWDSSEHLSAARYVVGDATVVAVTMDHSHYASVTVLTWFPHEDPNARLAGAAVLVSNDFGEGEDNGYYVWVWNNESTGSVTLERPKWPWSGGSRLAVDLVYRSKHVGIAGEMSALVALDRVPEGDPGRIGRFLRDAGLVRAPCLHQHLDPEMLAEARGGMAREEVKAAIRAAADFVVLDARHSLSQDGARSERTEVLCPQGRAIAQLVVHRDSRGTPRQLVAETTRAGTLDKTVYSYDGEGRLRFVDHRSVERVSNKTEVMRLWYDEVGNEAGSESGLWITRPRPALDPAAEIAWLAQHEAELRKVCEPGW
jgi:hypothetical protein